MNPKQLPNGRWIADWRDANGNRHRVTYRTQDTAKRALRQALDQRERGETPKPPVPTLKDFYEGTAQKIVRDQVTAVTWAGYRANMRIHVLDQIGHLPIDEITPAVLQDWIHSLDVGTATKHRVFSTLCSVMRIGAERGDCILPSKRMVRLGAEEVRRFHVPTIPEIQALSDAIDPRYSALVLMCGFTGMRQGEAFGLAPQSIGSDRIKVWQVLDRLGTRVDRTKSGHDRLVTLMPTVRDALLEHMEEFPDPSYVIHHNHKKMIPSWFHKHYWNPARKKVGLPDLRFHDLRHGAATIMIQVWKWDAVRVAVELGHTSSGRPNPGFTLSRYGHLWEQKPDTESMETALARALDGQKKPGAGLEPAVSWLQNSAPASDWDLLAEIADGWHRNA